MANELPKRPIQRVAVPTVKKEIPSLKEVKKESKDANSSLGRNTLLSILLIIVGIVVYVAIFKKEFNSSLFSTQTAKKELIESQSSEQTSEDVASIEEDSEEEFSSIIGEDKTPTIDGSQVVYPEGSTFYIISGTFIFYPYAEQFRDQMKKEGYKAEIISTGDDRKFHRVFLYSSKDISSMRAQRDKLIDSKGMNVWIYAEQ